MDKKRPIIRIWDLGNAKYQVDVDTLKITKNQAYSIMSVITKNQAYSIMSVITKNQAYSIMSVLAKIHKDEVKPNSSQD